MVMDHASVTHWLQQIPSAGGAALGQAYAAVYADLKQAAHAQLRRGGGEFNTTALVNETYLKLARDPGFRPQDRHALLALSARAMRQVLIDHARHRKADKRSGDLAQVTLHTGLAAPDNPIDVLRLDALLEHLSSADARAAAVVELRCFGGYAETEIAKMLDVTERTVQRDWRKARAFLMSQLEPARA